MVRTAALLAVLFAVYASTIGVDAFRNSDYGGDEPHYLLAAESLKRDRDVDVKDEYISKSYAKFYPYVLDKHGEETEGRLNEPHGVGFPLFILPAYLIGGPHGVELFLALIAALAVALGYRLALRVVPDPWAIGSAAVVGVSPPFLAYGTAIYPELTAGAALAGAALLALPTGRADHGAGRPSSAPSCSARSSGSAPSSWRRAWRSRSSPSAASGAPVARCSPSSPSRPLSSAGSSTSRSTRRSTAAPPPTPPTTPARPPPTPPSRAATPTAPTGSWPSSWTASTACCAGRPSSRSSSWASGGSGASTATTSRAWWPTSARSSSPAASARSCSASSCSWRPSSPPPCSASGSRRGTCSPACRWRSR